MSRIQLWTSRFVTGAVVGFVVVSICSAIVISHDKSSANNMFPFFYPLVFAVGVGVPVGTWLLLRMANVRPPGVTAVCGFFMSVVISLGAHGFMRGGAVGPAWMYGLCGALGYGCAALISPPVRNGTQRAAE